MLTHVIDRRMVVNLLQVDVIDSDAFFNLFLEELHGVVLRLNMSNRKQSQFTHNNAVNDV